MTTSNIRNLYGGAIQIDIPARFIDITSFRQVPDHQEIFVDEKTDQSVIIELLERQSHVSDAEAIKYHFEIISDESEISAEKRRVGIIRPITQEEMPNFLPTIPKFMMLAQQRVSKFKESAENIVNLHMALVRLERAKTDLLITFNEAISISTDSSSMKSVQNTNPSNQESIEQLFKSIIKSFIIKDYSLFQNQ
ncbi:hypothetical protein CYY_009806 [Polysphondylium violaceum]|uniref:Uncharacterized protein n=1 Tax=Polysphondylium violaceum TaxID=133409 RepID=A0A8J4PJN4_9MYCE|nr:hypothetical protein CYY_009806 [Polysphondylium violaceum]